MRHFDIYQKIIQILNEGKTAAVATIIFRQGSAPRSVGTKALIEADGTIIGTIGGGAVESKVCREALQVIADYKPKLLRFDLTKRGKVDMICGGIMDVFIEPVVPKPSLYIFGSGHVSIALARFALLTGMEVMIIDWIRRLKKAEMPVEVKLVIKQFEQFFSEKAIGNAGSIVIATGSHQEDEQVLALALKTPARYIGMLASRTKTKIIFEHLKGKGVSEEALSKVHAPIGIEIHAETPEEIAISILAELIKMQRS